MESISEYRRRVLSAAKCSGHDVDCMRLLFPVIVVRLFCRGDDFLAGGGTALRAL
jgi:hypothetical protein